MKSTLINYNNSIEFYLSVARRLHRFMELDPVPDSEVKTVLIQGFSRKEFATNSDFPIHFIEIKKDY